MAVGTRTQTPRSTFFKGTPTERSIALEIGRGRILGTRGQQAGALGLRTPTTSSFAGARVSITGSELPKPKEVEAPHTPSSELEEVRARNRGLTPEERAAIIYGQLRAVYPDWRRPVTAQGSVPFFGIRRGPNGEPVQSQNLQQ